MKVLRSSDTEVVVRFPKTVKDGTYLFTVARGNSDHERGEFHVAKVSAGSGGGETERGVEGPPGPAGPDRSRWTSGTGRRGWRRWTGWCAGRRSGRQGRRERLPGAHAGAGWAPGALERWSTGRSWSAGCAGSCGAGWPGGGLRWLERLRAGFGAKRDCRARQLGTIDDSSGRCVPCPAGKVPLAAAWARLNPANAATVPGGCELTPVHRGLQRSTTGEVGWIVTLQKQFGHLL